MGKGRQDKDSPLSSLVCSPVGHSVPERPNDFYIPAEYH